MYYYSYTVTCYKQLHVIPVYRAWTAAFKGLRGRLLALNALVSKLEVQATDFREGLTVGLRFHSAGKSIILGHYSFIVTNHPDFIWIIQIF